MTASSRSCDVVGLGAGEVLEQVAERLRGDDPQVDRDPVVGLGADAVRARVAGGRRSASGRRGARRAPPAPRRSRSGRCPCRSRPSAGPSRRPRPGWRPGARGAPRPAPRRPAAPSRAARGPAPSSGLAEPLERGEDVLLDLRAEALDVADLLVLGRLLQVLEGGDVELVVEAPRGFRAEAGDPRHLDQGRRELRLQLRGGRDLAGLEQRVDLLRERLADARDLGRASLRRRARRPRPGSRGSPEAAAE